MSLNTTYQAKFARWFLNPAMFVEEALRVQSPTTQQRDALQDWGRLLTAKMKRAEKKPCSTEELEWASKIGMAIHSGHGTGKDAFAAWIILHFLCCTVYPKVICTAPTDAQLRSILWSEIHKWLRTSLVKDQIVYQAEKVFLRAAGGKEWFAIPRTVSTNSSEEEQAETIAGFNAPFKLIVVDEASGVPDAVFRPLEGGLAGKLNLVLMIGNCTRSNGFFYQSHYGAARNTDTTIFDQATTAVKAQVTTNPSEWIVARWNAEDSENVNQDHVQRLGKKYGRDSNAYRIRVLGLPPTATADSLVQMDWLQAAVARDLDVAEDDALAVGVDVARYGDDLSVITACRGMVTVDVRDFSKLGNIEVAEWVGSVVRDQTSVIDRHGVGVDIIGVGAGVYDYLERFGSIQRLYPVNVAETPSQDTRFVRLRDEILWQVREEFQSGVVKIPNHPDLIDEANTIRWKILPNGKIEVERKADMKKRGLGSPNFLDSYAIARYVRRLIDGPQRWRKRRKRPAGTWATG